MFKLTRCDRSCLVNCLAFVVAVSPVLWLHLNRAHGASAAYGPCEVTVHAATLADSSTVCTPGGTCMGVKVMRLMQTGCADENEAACTEDEVYTTNTYYAKPVPVPWGDAVVCSGMAYIDSLCYACLWAFAAACAGMVGSQLVSCSVAAGCGICQDLIDDTDQCCYISCEVDATTKVSSGTGTNCL